MAKLFPILLVVVLAYSSHFLHLHAFVKLLPYGTDVEFISKVKNINLSHTFYRRESITEQSLDFGVSIISPVRDLKLQLIYYSVTGNGTVKTVLFKRAVDMCFYMQNPKSDRLVKVVYDYVRQRTNLPKRCPIPAANYYIRNIRPADVPVPAFIPEAEFILELIYRNEVKREIMVEFRFYGKLMTFAFYTVLKKDNTINLFVEQTVDLYSSYVKRTSADRAVEFIFDQKSFQVF